MSSTTTKVVASAFLAILLAILYANYDSDQESPLEDPSKVKIMSKLSVFVLGATGEVGKEVVKELARHGQFERVSLIGRRKIELPATDSTYNYAKFSQTIVDFDKLAEDHASAFQGFDVGISTLGTTRGKAGKAGFYKVDHDYVVESAKLAKLGGCKHLNLVSSASANKNSYVYYSQVKGEAEDELTQMGFDRLTIFRPGFLLCERSESRAVEKPLKFVFSHLDRWRKMSVETSVVAKAIISKTIQSSTKGPVEIVYNDGIVKLGKEELPVQ